MYREIALDETVNLLGAGRTLIVTSYDREQGISDALALSWYMPLRRDPPLFAFVLGADSWSRELIRREQEFVACLPGLPMARMVLQLAETSGRARDKFIACGIDGMESRQVTPPSVHGSLAHVEFKVVGQDDEEDGSTVFRARPVCARVLEGCFRGGTWDFSRHALGFLHWHGGRSFGIEERIMRL